MNCATLSQYYITMNNYASARHTLACASSVISNVEESSGSGYSDESYDNEKVGPAIVRLQWTLLLSKY